MTAIRWWSEEFREDLTRGRPVAHENHVLASLVLDFLRKHRSGTIDDIRGHLSIRQNMRYKRSTIHHILARENMQAGNINGFGIP